MTHFSADQIKVLEAQSLAPGLTEAVRIVDLFIVGLRPQDGDDEIATAMYAAAQKILIEVRKVLFERSEEC